MALKEKGLVTKVRCIVCNHIVLHNLKANTWAHACNNEVTYGKTNTRKTTDGSIR